jgi:hypothetical protein
MRAAVVIVASVLSVFPRLHAQEATENDVKAAFIYNFTKFVEWPDSPAQATQPVRVCVLADEEFNRSLDRILENETILGRRLVRAAPTSAQDARTCAILYISRGNAQRGAKLLSAVRDHPVLTVGESPRFLQEGGAIEFVLDHNRVRFDVSTTAMERAGLKVSSKLLRVARTVKGGT